MLGQLKRYISFHPLSLPVQKASESAHATVGVQAFHFLKVPVAYTNLPAPGSSQWG